MLNPETITNRDAIVLRKFYLFVECKDCLLFDNRTSLCSILEQKVDEDFFCAQGRSKT